EGQKGVFVAMPNRKTKDGEYRDTAHPLNNEMRKNIERAVIEEYNNKIAAEQK
ncbi:MAG TPA: septation protein SpoVG family protein, partial [bacterium]|nr:septation protein SpoVG family protein [bacterium]